MKKFLALVLTLVLCVSIVACGGKKNTDIIPEVDAASVGGQHWDAFVSYVEANPEATTEDIANELIFLEINQFMGGVMPIEVGAEYLPGFDNYVPTGFASAANFMPMIGSIPYVGYVFELAEDADVAAFAQALADNANPRWNICVEADQTVVGTKGNKVFFLMCPASYDMGGEDAGMGGMSLGDVEL